MIRIRLVSYRLGGAAWYSFDTQVERQIKKYTATQTDRKCEYSIVVEYISVHRKIRVVGLTNKNR